MEYQNQHEDSSPVQRVKKWAGRLIKVSMLFLLFTVFFSFESEATHYRYGNITWSRPNSASRTVTFTVTQSWRRSYPIWPGAVVGQILDPGINFLFGDGGGAPMLVTVTSVNAAEDWVYGTYTVSHTYSSFGNFTASYAGAARLSTLLNNNDRGFSSQSVVNLGSATNLSSPVSSLPPIINLATGIATAHFTIPALDPDAAGALSFVLSTQPEAGGGDLFVNPAGLTVNNATGVVSFSTVGKAVGNLYNAAVTITDAAGSKTMVDFIIRIVGFSNPPVFNYSVGFTPVNGQLYSLNPGQTLDFNVRADDIDPLDIVKLSAVGLAAGMNFTPALPLTGAVDAPVTTHFNWTPTGGQLGVYIVTFIAEDLVGTQTTTTVTINVNTNPIFIPPTPALASVRYAESGMPVTDIIKATNPDPAVSTQLFSASLPPGSTLTGPLPTPLSATPTAAFNWVPAPSDWGANIVSVTARDQNSRTTTHTYELFVNTMPVFTSVPVTGAIVNQVYSYNVVATDADVPFGDDLETDLFGTVLPSWLTYISNGDGTGTLTGTPSLGDLGSYSISFIAEDIVHHSHPDVLQTFSITVAGVPPTVTCPSDITVAAPASGCAETVTYSATATGVPAPTVTYSPASGSLFTVGTHVVTVTASNGVGSDAVCTFNVTVEDNTHPTITGCPSTISVTTTGGNPLACGQVVTWTPPTASDNCSILSFTSDHSPGDVFPVGTTLVVYTATDASGNTTTCSFGVIVTDNTFPTITGCPASFIVTSAMGNAANCSQIATWTPPVASDNCGVLSFTSDHAPGDAFPVGTTLVVYTATDLSGNTATCSFGVTVVDNTNPVIQGCSNNISLNACTPTATWAIPTATDNCPGVTVTQTGGPAPGSSFLNGSTTLISYVATDVSGNTANCSFYVTRAPAFNAVCSVNNPQLYYGYAGDQTATITATPGSGGVPPYKVSITMNRALKCNIITSAGDELWIGGANTNSSLNTNTVCPGTGAGLVPSSTSNLFTSGSYSVNVTLMAGAVITATITDANGCTSTCSKTIAAEDVRCFAGNSGNAKVAICHQTGSANEPCHQICVSESAIEAHLAHGDFLGNCTANCVAPVAFTGRNANLAVTPAEVDGLNLKVMPNPSAQSFNLGIQTADKKNVEIRVYNVSGKQVYSASGAADKTYRFGDALIAGVYLVEVRQGEQRSTIRVVKQ